MATKRDLGDHVRPPLSPNQNSTHKNHPSQDVDEEKSHLLHQIAQSPDEDDEDEESDDDDEDDDEDDDDEDEEAKTSLSSKKTAQYALNYGLDSLISDKKHSSHSDKTCCSKHRIKLGSPHTTIVKKKSK